MSLESSIAAAEVGPIAGLSFKLPPVSSYVTGRQEVYFVPSGSQFGPNAVRTLRISASGHAFADLSSAVLEYTITNNDATNALQMLNSSAGVVFSELRVLASGIELERIGGGGCSYARIEECLNRTLPVQKRVDAAGLAFEAATHTAANATLDLFQGGVLQAGSIAAAGGNTIVYHKPLFGLGQQHCWAPLWALTGNGFTWEFLLEGTPANCCVTDVVAGVSGSTNYTISGVKLHLDTLTVDEALMSSYSSHLLAQKSLVVPFRSYVNLSFSNSSKDVMLQIPRTFSRVNQVIVLCSKAHPSLSGSRKDANYFPAFGANTLESWIQIGSQKWPNNTYGPGLRSHYMRYLKALGYLTSGHNWSSNSLQTYTTDSMALFFDLERTPGAQMSGTNSHGGNMTLSLRNLGTDTDHPTRIDVLIWFDSLWEIMDGTCSVSF